MRMVERGMSYHPGRLLLESINLRDSFCDSSDEPKSKMRTKTFMRSPHTSRFFARVIGPA
jgi:hypothetical protein